MQTTKQPYELLVRWAQDGTLAGAHVQWRYVVSDGATVVAESVSAAECVAVGSTNGFPLADLLSQVQTDALTGIDAARAAQTGAEDALEQKTSEADQFSTQLADKVAELVAAESQLEAAQAELAALRADQQ